MARAIRVHQLFGVSRHSLASWPDAVRFRALALLLAAGQLSAFRRGGRQVIAGRASVVHRRQSLLLLEA